MNSPGEDGVNVCRKLDYRSQKSNNTDHSLFKKTLHVGKSQEYVSNISKQSETRPYSQIIGLNMQHNTIAEEATPQATSLGSPTQ